MKNDVFRAVLVLGAIALAASARADEATLFVYDSAGKLVGPQSTPNIVNLVLVGTKEPVSINVSVTALGAPTSLFFTTSDCSGPVYLLDNQATDLVRPAYLDLTKPGSIIYPDWSQPGVPLKSFRNLYRGGPSLDACAKYTEALGVPVKRTSVSRQGFTPPFSVRRQR